MEVGYWVETICKPGVKIEVFTRLKMGNDFLGNRRDKSIEGY
jgi:hypothetical protein